LIVAGEPPGRRGICENPAIFSKEALATLRRAD
jgi:hypothetical protein